LAIGATCGARRHRLRVRALPRVAGPGRGIDAERACIDARIGWWGIATDALARIGGGPRGASLCPAASGHSPGRLTTLRAARIGPAAGRCSSRRGSACRCSACRCSACRCSACRGPADSGPTCARTAARRSTFPRRAAGGAAALRACSAARSLCALACASALGASAGSSCVASAARSSRAASPCAARPTRGSRHRVVACLFAQWCGAPTRAEDDEQNGDADSTQQGKPFAPP
jgi:hypothetical protein